MLKVITLSYVHIKKKGEMMNKPRKIVSTTILVEWSDNPKPVVLNNDMPSQLANDFDDWLTECEEEEQG